MGDFGREAVAYPLCMSACEVAGAEPPEEKVQDRGRSGSGFQKVNIQEEVTQEVQKIPSSHLPPLPLLHLYPAHTRGGY